MLTKPIFAQPIDFSAELDAGFAADWFGGWIILWVLQVVRSGLLEVIYLQVAVPERPGHTATGSYEDS